MKLSILLSLLFIFLSGFVNAEAETQNIAYVYLDITNPVPRIENISITSPAYSFSRIECEVEIIDNNPDSVRLSYEWEVDGKLVSKEDSVPGIEPGKEVTCRVEAYDSAGQGSNELKASAVISEINVFGITGNAVKNIGTSGNSLSLIILSLLLLYSIRLILNQDGIQ